MKARWDRTARGWSVALLAGVLTAALHASAGGSFPAPAVVLLAVLLSGLVSTALVGRAPSAPRLAGTVAAGQVTFHTVFTVFGNTAGVVLAADAHAGHAGHGAMAIVGSHASTAHTGSGMLLAHAVAGLLSAFLLAHGERALRELKRIAASPLRVLRPAPSFRPLPRRRSVGIAHSVPALRSAALLGTLRYRGPPALLRAA